MSDDFTSFTDEKWYAFFTEIDTAKNQRLTYDEFDILLRRVERGISFMSIENCMEPMKALEILEKLMHCHGQILEHIPLNVTNG